MKNYFTAICIPRTLENELERLRTSGELLTSCEVNYKDVEWRPGDVLGEGSFSTVYKGFYCGTEVAVKELKFKLSQVVQLLLSVLHSYKLQLV